MGAAQTLINSPDIIYPPLSQGQIVQRGKDSPCPPQLLLHSQTLLFFLFLHFWIPRELCQCFKQDQSHFGPALETPGTQTGHQIKNPNLDTKTQAQSLFSQRKGLGWEVLVPSLALLHPGG